MAIDANYVSPNLRLAFAREDDPDADLTFEVAPAAEHIPELFRDGTQWVVVATLERPGKAPISEWKEVPTTIMEKGKRIPFAMNPENYQKLCTMAAGRTLKRAGYPDRIQEFTALVTWRRRNRELELSLAGGKPVAAIGTGGDDKELTQALEAAATRDGDGDVIDAEVIDEDRPAPTAPTPAAAQRPAAAPQAASQPAAATPGPATPDDALIADLGLGTLIQNRYLALPADLRAQVAPAILNRVPATGHAASTAQVRLVDALLRPLEAQAAARGPSGEDALPLDSPPPADDGPAAGADLVTQLRQGVANGTVATQAPPGPAAVIAGFDDEKLERFTDKLNKLGHEPQMCFDEDGKPYISNLDEMPAAAVRDAIDYADPF
jgi:hypothetical protein